MVHPEPAQIRVLCECIRDSIKHHAIGEILNSAAHRRIPSNLDIDSFDGGERERGENEFFHGKGGSSFVRMTTDPGREIV